MHFQAHGTKGTRSSAATVPGPGDLAVEALIGGECRASLDPHKGYSTVLGSCVSLCLFDPVSKAGGMNHFLLPEPPGTAHDGRNPDWSFRYGVQAMEELLNAVFRLSGRSRNEFRAKLVGGAHLGGALADVGSRNLRFAEDFLEKEGITILSRHTAGTVARRLLFHPATGRAFVKEIQGLPAPELASREERLPRRARALRADETELICSVTGGQPHQSTATTTATTTTGHTDAKPPATHRCPCSVPAVSLQCLCSVSAWRMPRLPEILSCSCLGQLPLAASGVLASRTLRESFQRSAAPNKPGQGALHLKPAFAQQRRTSPVRVPCT